MERNRPKSAAVLCVGRVCCEGWLGSLQRVLSSTVLTNPAMTRDDEAARGNFCFSLLKLLVASYSYLSHNPFILHSLPRKNSSVCA